MKVSPDLPSGSLPFWWYANLTDYVSLFSLILSNILGFFELICSSKFDLKRMFTVIIKMINFMDSFNYKPKKIIKNIKK